MPSLPSPGNVSRMEAITHQEGGPYTAAAMLHRLAAALGCPVEPFARPSGNLDQTTELLRLWMGMHREEDRAEVLAILKGVGARTNAGR